MFLPHAGFLVPLFRLCINYDHRSRDKPSISAQFSRRVDRTMRADVGANKPTGHSRCSVTEPLVCISNEIKPQLCV